MMAKLFNKEEAIEIVSVGADPEFFAKDGDAFVSAHDLVPGTKVEPAPLKKIKGAAVQADGVAIEVNIPPSYSREEFSTHIKGTIQEVRKLVPEKFQFSFEPVADFAPAYFKTIPPHALELGCDPDFSGFNDGAINPKPVPKGDMEFSRSGGGHIHVGFNTVKDVRSKSHLWDCAQVALALDCYIGAHSLLWDTDKRRARLYGAGAAFRPKKYGMELRSPSNAWLKHEGMWPWLFDVVQHVNKTMKDGTYKPHVWTDQRYYMQTALKAGPIKPIKDDRYGMNVNVGKYRDHSDYNYKYLTLEDMVARTAKRMADGPVFPLEVLKNG